MKKKLKPDFPFTGKKLLAQIVADSKKTTKEIR